MVQNNNRYYTVFIGNPLSPIYKGMFDKRYCNLHLTSPS